MKPKRKIRLGILFGGRSSEHEISLLSARSIIEAVDKNLYDVSLIGIGKDGRWLCPAPAGAGWGRAGVSPESLAKGKESYLLNASDPKKIAINVAKTKELALRPGREGIGPIDVVFPVLHGTYGEDGSIQGLLRMLDLPFVGPDILGSAVGMDKDVAKRLLRDARIPVADFLTYGRHVPRSLGEGGGDAIKLSAIWKRLGKPVFVKPANQGSSVGVAKAKNDKELRAAIADAFSYDDKILIEEAVIGREIEVAVLGNEMPEASVAGEVVPHHDFYSYEAKYLDEHGAGLMIPAKLPKALLRKAQALAVRTFKTLGLEGMARVDFFMKKNGTFVVNEVNTIPGFTKISMYPKLWAASGLSYPKLIDRLVRLALERHARRRRLKTSV
jgi:D-alanine-D-alanine ligase